MGSLYKYGHRVADEKKVARSQGHDMDASYKDLANVCSAIKHKRVEAARKVLGEAIEMKTPIPYSQFNKGLGHRSQLGGKKGRFPKKECRLALAILDNAVANAAKKGFDESALYVKHAAAYKQNVLPRYRRTWVGGATLGYGKQAFRSDYETARMEITLEERQQPSVKEKAQKKGPKKTAAAAGPKPQENKNAAADGSSASKQGV